MTETDYEKRMNRQDETLADYIASITFVDKDGKPVELPVRRDATPDPEGDRG